MYIKLFNRINLDASSISVDSNAIIQAAEIRFMHVIKVCMSAKLPKLRSKKTKTNEMKQECSCKFFDYSQKETLRIAFYMSRLKLCSLKSQIKTNLFLKLLQSTPLCDWQEKLTYIQVFCWTRQYIYGSKRKWKPVNIYELTWPERTISTPYWYRSASISCLMHSNSW